MADLTIADVRKKYPQYGDMTDEALGKALHDKFYKDMPYDQFASKIGLRTKDYRYDIPDSGKPPEAPKPDTRTFAQKADAMLTGLGEAGAAMATGAATGLAGRVATLADQATGGTGEAGVRIAQKGYQPKTEEGKDALEAIGRTLEASGLAGLGPTAALEGAAVAPAIGVAARQASSAGRQATGFARKVVGKAMAKDIPDDLGAADMAGIGSAATAAETLRRERAAALPVPIDLTKGQATRDFAQQQFEREAAKSPTVGEPLRKRYAEQNAQILQNMDAWFDQTGAQAGGLRATGEAVTNAIVTKSHKAKAEINAAYKAARESGDMAAQVDAVPLYEYIQQNQAAQASAPLLTSVEKQLGRIAANGKATVNDLEELRKMVNNLSGKDAVASHYGREVRGVIDSMTEGKGGDLYKKARALRQRYAQEFENRGVVAKLLDTKPGTTDPAVALEDVFNHSILKGSLDDVRVMRKTLQTAGPKGEQAWRELQGATIQHIKDEITKNVQTDTPGNRIISAARLDRLVTELDKDGKLDFIFGKQGAQQLRDVNGIAKDVLTHPPGAVNYSNTAAVLTQTLERLADRYTGIPFAGRALNWVAKEKREAAERARVKESLEP